MSQTDLTVDETLDSLTGFDEIAIAHHFGSTWTELAETDASMLGRSLVFIDKRRGGATDDEARNLAMEMRLKDVNDYFPDPPEEGEAGKDEPPAPSPETSLSSVS